MQTLDLKEAARYLHCHEDTLREMAVSGEVPGAKVGRAWVFVDDDLVGWLRKQYKCRSTNGETSGTTASSTPRESAIGAARAKRTSGKRKSTTMTLGTNSDKEDLADLLLPTR